MADLSKISWVWNRYDDLHPGTRFYGGVSASYDGVTQYFEFCYKRRAIGTRVIEVCVIWEVTAKCDSELEPEQKYHA